MKSLAQKYVDRLRKAAPRKRMVVNKTASSDELILSPRFILLGDVALQTVNISTVQKFERADHELIDEPVMARVRLFGLFAILIVVAFVGAAIVFKPLWLAVFALLAIPAALYAYFLWSILSSKQHLTNDYFVEIAMNSGRKHRIYCDMEKTAEDVLQVMVKLMASSEAETVYRFDAIHGKVVEDDVDLTILDSSIDGTLSFSAGVEDEDNVASS